MKAFTKELKKESEWDVIRIRRHNNSKWDKMTSEQKEQHINDKKDFYILKWLDYKHQATTAAQRRLCDSMVDYARRNTR